MKKIRIATRKSSLALAQTNIVKENLLRKFPDLNVEIIGTTTKGDRILNQSLAKIGGKGLFIKELEQLLLEKKADIAVHSMKDIPAELSDELIIGSILTRQEANDAFISNKFNSFHNLPSNAIIGTSSLRRSSQLLTINPDLITTSLRGNIETRLKKLEEGQYDAIILAAVALKRLNMENKITEIIPTELMLPACGQGAIGIECRKNDEEILEIIKTINDDKTQSIILAEREVNRILDVGCQAPVAAYATYQNGLLSLSAKVLSIDGKQIIKAEHKGELNNSVALGNLVANKLISNGARDLIKDAKKHFNNQT